MDKFGTDTKGLMQPEPLKKPLDKLNLGTEDAALRSLVGFLNNPEVTGAVVPPEEKAAINQVFDRRGTTVVTTDPVFTSQSSPSQSIVSEQSPTASVPPLGSTNGISIGRKIFFTGRIGVGKDYLANAIGAKVLGFADPMYALVEYLTGVKVTANDGKNIAGIRKMLQQIGQFGRDEVNEQYPYTVERSMFCLMVRSLANQKITFGNGVDWGRFGLDQDLWVKGLLNRAESVEQIVRHIAVTNCRFNNEYRKLIADGWQHFHVTCSPQTWALRLASVGLKPDSKETADMSEVLARSLDNNLTIQISKQRVGPKLHCIWNDSLPCPTNRLLTTAEFLAL